MYVCVWFIVVINVCCVGDDVCVELFHGDFLQ